MKAIFGLFATLLLILALLLGIAVGVGLLLEWLLAVERSFAILIGVIATTVSVHFLLRVLGAEPSLETAERADAELPEVLLGPPPSWRRRPRKPKRPR